MMDEVVFPVCECVLHVYLPLVYKVGVPVLLYYISGKVQPINRSPSSVVLAVSSPEMGPSRKSLLLLRILMCSLNYVLEYTKQATSPWIIIWH